MRAWLAFVMVAGCATASSSEQQQDAPPVKIDAAIDAAKEIDANLCGVTPCDIQTQCGCTAAQACDIDFSDLIGNACRNKIDTGVEGSTCIAAASCAKKYVCLGGMTNRSCARYCGSNTDCLGPRGQCVIQITGNGAAIPGAIACSSNCDPSSTTNPLCPDTWTCDLFTSTFMGTAHQIVDCRKAGAATQGQACSTSVICATGLTCVTQGAAMKCAKICTPPANAGCPAATTCQSFGTPFTVGGTVYGACL